MSNSNSSSTPIIRSNLDDDEDIDQPSVASGQASSSSFHHQQRPSTSHQQQPLYSHHFINRRHSSGGSHHHRQSIGPPIDEEDEDLFNAANANIGMFSREGSDNHADHERRESFSSSSPSGVASLPTALLPSSSPQKIGGGLEAGGDQPVNRVHSDHQHQPARSWTVKLQAARSYVATTSSTSAFRSNQPNGKSNSNNNNNFGVDMSSVNKSLSSSSLNNNNSFATEENFNFVSIEHADTSFPVFLELWQQEQVCDVTIVVGERR